MSALFPRWSNTAFRLSLVALVESREGRPIKVEGNPEHPASLGATSAYHQASVLDLYDPGRVAAVRRDGALASWNDVLLGLQRPTGWRPWFVLPPQSSPLIGVWVERVVARYPAARFSFVSPVSRRPVYEATQIAFGRPLEPQYDVGRARVILSLGADFLAGMPMSLRWARQFARNRRAATADAAMSRLYVVEPMPTPTGSCADHRVAVRSGALTGVAGAILREVVSQAGDLLGARLPPAFVASLPRAEDTAAAAFVRAVAADLWRARGSALVMVGDGLPTALHLCGHALNTLLGSPGELAWFAEPALLGAPGSGALTALAEALDDRRVDAVLVLDSNPVYWAPPALDLERRLRSAPESFHLTASDNETARACRWVAPLSHYLESWGDARAQDGTLSFIQPLIEPLHPSRSVLELLAACAGQADARGHSLLVDHYRAAFGASFEARFEEGLRAGVVANSAALRLTPRPKPALGDLAHNPDVTVRERGVMEKCTYCVQRIRRAEMRARIEKRAIGPGEVVTACQQACPTEAIQFGSLHHAGSAMLEWRKEGRAYAVLHELGTRPRTQYLAKILNPNPELEPG